MLLFRQKSVTIRDGFFVQHGFGHRFLAAFAPPLALIVYWTVHILFEAGAGTSTLNFLSISRQIGKILPDSGIFVDC